MSTLIKLAEGDARTYTLTAKRDGTAINVTTEIDSGSVKLYCWDEGAAEGTNVVDGISCTDSDKANGVVLAAITAVHTALSAGETLKGGWRIKLDDGSGGIEWLDEGEFLIEKNHALA